MKQRILDINPQAKVEAHVEFYTEELAGKYINNDINYVIDAVDTVTAKISLIEECTKRNIKIISCMGTGNKLDPIRLEVSDISKTSVCPLAKVVRQELRKRNIEHVKVVYSKEEPIKHFEELNKEDTQRKIIPASVSFVPSVAGLIVAGEVVKDLIKD